MSTRPSALRSALRKQNSSPYSRPRKPAKSLSWLGGLLNFLNPLRITSTSPEPKPAQEPEPIIVDDDEVESSTESVPSPQPVAPPADPDAEFRRKYLNHPLRFTLGIKAPLPLSLQSPPLPPPPAAAAAAETTPPPPAPSSPSPHASPPPPRQPEPSRTISSAAAPATAHAAPNLHASSSDHLAKVAAFLERKQGQPINEMESAGLLACIRQAQEEDMRETSFRFTVTPSVSRATSPTVTPHQPRKLKMNPNGIYRYEGAGSALSRTRCRSPAPGSPRSPSQVKSTPPETPSSDTKRRRIDAEDPSTLMPPPPVPVPAVATPTPRLDASTPSSSMRAPPSPALPFPLSNVAPSPTNGLNGVSRHLPVKPSPLRQAWSSSTPDASSVSSAPPAVPTPTVPTSRAVPTKAADFMTSLIKEVTPKRESAVMNPYQSASPVVPATKKSLKRGRVTRSPAPQAPSVESKETAKVEEKELSTQAIIEATVPKGITRSRPPANLSSSQNGTLEEPLGSPEEMAADLPAPSRDRSVTPPMEDDRVLGDSWSPLRGKQREVVDSPALTNGIVNGSTTKLNGTPAVNGIPSPPSPPPVIIEVIDVDMPASPEAETVHVKPAEVIEPLANGVTPHPKAIPTTGSPFSGPGVGSSPPSSPQARGLGMMGFAPKEPSKLRFSYQPPSTPSSAAPTPPPPSVLAPVDETKPADPKADAWAMDVDTLPTYQFHFSQWTNVDASYSNARDAAWERPVVSLPGFDLTPPASGSTVVGFNWGAAGMQPPSTAQGGEWTCGTCMLSNPASVVDQCRVCETPR